MKLNLNGIVLITLKPNEIELVNTRGESKSYHFDSEEEKFKALKEAEEEDPSSG